MESAFDQTINLLAQQRISRLAPEMRRAAFDAIVAGIAFMLIFAAIGCAVAALWLLLAPRIGAPGAALSAAAALLIAGGAIIWLRRIFAPRRDPQAQVPTPNPAEPDLVEAATQAFGANKMALLLAALMAGATISETLRTK